MKFCLLQRTFAACFSGCVIAILLNEVSCYSQDQTINDAAKNVCRVVCKAPDGSLHIGSGTFLRDEVAGDWVLTAGHVIETQAASRGRVTCEFRNGETIGGIIDGYDPIYDQAAIKLDRKPNLPGCPIRSTPLQNGETVWFVGYAHGRDFLLRSGQFVGRARPVAQGAKADWCTAGVGVISGMSGGPAFDLTGHIVGNLWGSTGSDTSFCGVNRNKLFLRKLFPSLSTNADNAWSNDVGNNGSCNNGRCPIQTRPNLPTQPTPPPNQSSPSKTPPAQPPCPACNCDLKPIIARIDQLETNINKLRGQQSDLANNQGNISQQLQRLTQQQSELAATTINLVDASNKLVAELDRRTDPNTLAQALPGITVIHNGTNKGAVKLGESLRLNFKPK